MWMNRMYALGSHIEVVTDHQPLIPIYTPDSNKPRPLRVDSHRTKLLQFDYHVIYMPGKETPCDYGSRHPPETAHFSDKEKEEWCIQDGNDIQVNRVIDDILPSSIPLQVIQKETKDDSDLQHLKEDITTRKQCSKDLSSYKGIFNELALVNGLIMRGDKIVIPKSLQNDVIGLAHECHLGAEKTVALIRETCWFPRMTQMVKEFVQTCKGCLSAISNTPPVPLEPNLLPDRPWQHLHGDFKGPIGGKYYMHIIIDQYSKFPEVDIVTTTSFEKLRPVLDRIFSTHGIPEKLSTDNGSPYTSDALAQYAKEMGFQLTPVTPRDPQCNGFAENFIKTLCKLLHTCAAEEKDPKRELHRFLLQYRATPHLTTGRSPAEMLFNRRIRTKLPIYQVDSETDEQKEIRKNHDEKKLVQKKNFDRRRRAIYKKVNVGDEVLIRQEKTTTRPPFNPNPFKVTAVNGNQITMTDGDKSFKRDKNQIKVYQRRTDDLKPSWEQKIQTQSHISHNTTYDNAPFQDSNEPLPSTKAPVSSKGIAGIGVESPEDQENEEVTFRDLEVTSGEDNGIAVTESGQFLADGHEGTSGSEPVVLDSDMTSHMEQLFARAQQNLQELEGNESNKCTTRSSGKVLQWNPMMDSENVLVEKELNENVDL